MPRAPRAPWYLPITTSACAACARCWRTASRCRWCSRIAMPPASTSGSTASHATRAGTASRCSRRRIQTRPRVDRARARRAARFPVLLLLSLACSAASCWRCRARRLQHARLAAAEVSRPRAGQLGGAARGAARPAPRCTRWSPNPTPAPSWTARRCRSCRTTPRVEVFRKVTVAAELALHRCLPALIAGTARHTPQDLAAGSYFGRRTRARRRHRLAPRRARGA